MAGRSIEKDMSSNFSGERGAGAGIKTLMPCFLLFLLSLLLSSCGTPYGIYHRVEKGQTLHGIAKAYNVPANELIKVNNFKESVNLKEGDAVFVPGASREKMIDVTIEYKTGAAPLEPKKHRHQAETPSRDVSTTVTKGEKGRFIWPLNGKVISEFGMRNGEKHAGIDIKADEGTPVKAADSGKVIYSGDGLNGYGNLIIIKHEGTFFTVYAHNKKNLVSEGDLVDKGTEIAKVGETGRATTPHLHFEVRKNKVTVDPILFLP